MDQRFDEQQKLSRSKFDLTEPALLYSIRDFIAKPHVRNGISAYTNNFHFHTDPRDVALLRNHIADELYRKIEHLTGGEVESGATASARHSGKDTGAVSQSTKAEA